MKMSMSKKLYAIVILLIILAMSIAGVGYWGMSAMNRQIVLLGQISGRGTALNEFYTLVIERGSGLKDVILADTDATIKKYVDQVMNVQAGFDKAAKTYMDNTPPESSQLALNTPVEVGKLWEDYGEPLGTPVFK